MTTTGRKPVPTHLKLLRGNPGQRRLNDEPQPEQLPDVPEPPPFITGYAADEWWITGTELHRLGLLTKVDIPALACYCHAYAQWRMAAESLAKMAANDPVMHAQIVKSKLGDAIANPLVSIMRKHAGDVIRYASEFGLTPAARSRITSGIHGDDSQSKFAGLIAG
jgi:P27 family predicted phage terminase small subunit